ncbi:hypothetical protein OGATHE_000537 [Ogataea polymorpha]|uniref:Uncharacterized protein n=1 Tax=Ogataea polymorpha TaxID=460523 RepID=A0A9P8TFQ2_9ASCO|nr:hypothetical protein OGATHE_000537 [Ogataea polymorpha]
MFSVNLKYKPLLFLKFVPEALFSPYLFSIVLSLLRFFSDGEFDIALLIWPIVLISLLVGLWSGSDLSLLELNGAGMGMKSEALFSIVSCSFCLISLFTGESFSRNVDFWGDLNGFSFSLRLAIPLLVGELGLPVLYEFVGFKGDKWGMLIASKYWEARFFLPSFRTDVFIDMAERKTSGLINRKHTTVNKNPGSQEYFRVWCRDVLDIWREARISEIRSAKLTMMGQPRNEGALIQLCL